MMVRYARPIRAVAGWGLPIGRTQLTADRLFSLTRQIRHGQARWGWSDLQGSYSVPGAVFSARFRGADVNQVQ